MVKLWMVSGLNMDEVLIPKGDYLLKITDEKQKIIVGGKIHNKLVDVNLFKYDVATGLLTITITQPNVKFGQLKKLFDLIIK